MRNQLTLDALCRELQMNCGDALAACKAVGVSLIFLNQWRKDDKEVHEKITEAERVGTQGLVSAAIQRGVQGIQKDVYYKGIVVGQQTEYSDSLLNTLLRVKVPEFAKDGEHAPQVTVNIANLMPRATTYEEWLAMKDATLSRVEQPALPAPVAEETVQDAVFEEVPVSAFAGLDL